MTFFADVLGLCYTRESRSLRTAGWKLPDLYL